MVKVRLFAYGTLRPDESPPKTMTDSERDSISGEDIEHENKSHYAEVDKIGHGPSIIRGYTLVIEHSELPDLDKREAPEYKRVQVMTANGHRAYTYSYTKRKPETKALANKEGQDGKIEENTYD